MNASDKITSQPLPCCGFTQHAGCIFENVTVTEEHTIRSATINLTGKSKAWQKCDCFRNQEAFDRMLDFIERGGFVNILIDGELPHETMKYFQLNNGFQCKEYRANKDFSALFSKENPYTILYYYSCINSKAELITGALRILIKLKLYRLLWRIYTQNRTIVLRRIHDN